MLSIILTLLVSGSVPWLSGCATVGAFGGSGRGDRAGGRNSDIDPARAHKHLAQIEPVIAKPISAEPVKELSERATRQIAKAEKLAGEQRYTEAAIELERALRYDPDHPRIHRSLAMLHWSAGNLERARTHVAKSLGRKPDDAAAHYLDGRCHAMGGDFAAAITAYRTALLCDDFGSDPEIAALCHYQLAEALEKERYLSAALSEFGAFGETVAALDGEPQSAELTVLLATTGRSAGAPKARILEKLGRYAEAADALAPVAAAAPNDIPLNLRYARLLLRAGRLDQALAVVREVRTEGDDDIELLFEIHTAAGHPEGIIEDLRSRIRDRPGDPIPVVNLAEMLKRLGRAEDAREELAGYIKDHPDAHQVRAHLVDLLIERSAWEDVLSVCADGLQRYPDHAVALEEKVVALTSNKSALDVLLTSPVAQESAVAAYLRGILAAAARRWDKAEVYLQESLLKEPGSIPCRAELADVYLRTYRYEEALKVASRAEQDTPEDVRIELVLARVHERLDDLEQAELHYRAATQLDRTDVEAMYELATVYRRAGDRLRAQRQLQVLLEKFPDYEAARELLAFSYLEDRKRDVALEQFEELERRAKKPTTKARCKGLINQLRLQAPSPEAYRDVLLEAVREHGSDAATWIAIAESYDVDAAPEERIRAFRHVIELEPDNEEAVLGLVEALQRMLAFEEAAQRLSDLLPRRPNRHAWRLGLIELRLILQDSDAALAMAEAGDAREDLTDQWRRQYRLAVVDALQLADRGEEALQRLEQWAKAEAKPSEWSTRLAAEYLRLDRKDEALAIYESLHQADPDRQELAFILSEALVAAGRFDRGAQYVLDWLANDPENENAIFRLARLLIQDERYDDAEELINNRLLLTYVREEYQDLLIGMLIQDEDYDDALDLIEKLTDEALGLMRFVHDAPPPGEGKQLTDEEIARRPNEPFTLENLHSRVVALRLNLATCLILARDYQAVENQLTSWLEASREPTERFELLRRLALCHRARGDEEQANEALSRALLLKPGDFTLNNDVAYGWIDQGVNLDRAEPMIRYVLARLPRQGAYLDTYGWLLYKKGEFAEAKKWLTRAALAQRDVDSVVLDHLGDTCWRLGEREEALAHWTESVEKMRQRDEDSLLSADERRVSETTPKKIDDARAGRQPEVALLAAPSSDKNDGTGVVPEG